MNKLDRSKRAQILRCLTEGTSIRAAARLTDCAINSVVKLLIQAGRACTEYQDRTLRKLNCQRLQLDEVWSFVYCKEKNATAEEKAAGAGDAWTWTALDADSKAIVGWFVGPRNARSAFHFIGDLVDRMASRKVQITTDGLSLYVNPVHSMFCGEADYAQLQKIYGTEPMPSGRYSPAQCMGSRRAVLNGNPDPAHVSTSYVERQHLTLRMNNRRFTRLTNAFSKKLQNLEHSVALYTMSYNFCKIHSSHRVTPAMQLGIADHVWETEEIVDLIDALEMAGNSK